MEQKIDFKKPLQDFDLSVRALNCLKAADLDTLGELVSLDKDDLEKFRNFGKKTLAELEDFLTSIGLSFGIDVNTGKLKEIKPNEEPKQKETKNVLIITEIEFFKAMEIVDAYHAQQKEIALNNYKSWTLEALIAKNEKEKKKELEPA